MFVWVRQCQRCSVERASDCGEVRVGCDGQSKAPEQGPLILSREPVVDHTREEVLIAFLQVDIGNEQLANRMSCGALARGLLVYS
jgi:hypothetical protein